MTESLFPDRPPQLNFDPQGLLAVLASALYVDKDQVLQELFANSTDAITLRSLTDPTFSRGKGRIDIALDRVARSITLTDNGIGVPSEQLDLAFQIGNSGKLRDLSAASQEGPQALTSLVGRFGLGIYSSFIICDELLIDSCPLNSPAFKITMTPDWRSSPLSSTKTEVGTTLTLRLRPDLEHLTNPAYIESLIVKYCQLVPYPIYLDSQKIWHGRRASRKQSSESDFIKQIEQLLVAEGFDFQREPAIGGVKPDFLIRGPSGQTVIIEAKAWASSTDQIIRASEQLQHYRQATGTNAVLLVLPQSMTETYDEGLTGIQDLAPRIRAEFTKFESTFVPKPPPREARTIFAAMPFSAEYDDTFFVGMVAAAEDVGAVCVRVDNEEFSGDVVAKIHQLIQASSAVIGDISESRQNVLYELGYAHALKKPVVHITSTQSSNLPFDVRNWNTILYTKGRTHALRRVLVQRLRAVLM